MRLNLKWQLPLLTCAKFGVARRRWLHLRKVADAAVLILDAMKCARVSTHKLQLIFI